MSLNTSAILHKKPGFLVPDLMLKKLTVAFPTAFGFAGQLMDTKSGVRKLQCESLQKGLPLGELQELQLAFKDEHLLMFFANFPKAVMPDDIQPWSINAADGSPIVSFFFEGDCKDYEGLNGDHTGEYCASDEIIFPRLAKAGEVATVDGVLDVDKFIDELKKQGLQKALCGAFEERGVYAFLAAKGEPICFGDNKLGGEFPWGRTSHLLGYSEAATTTEKVTEVAKSALTFLRGHGAPAKAAADTAPAVEVPEPGVKEDTPGTSVPSVTPTPAKEPKLPADADLEAKGYKRMFPPPKMGRGKARNLWLRTFNCATPGQLPADHESSQCAVWVQPELIELAQRSVTAKNEVDNLATAVHKFRKATETAVTGVDVAPKQTKAERIAIETAELARQELLSKPTGEEKPITRSNTREKYVPPATTTTKDVSVMSDENKEKAMNRLAGYLDKHRKRPTPLELQKAESKHANFSESTSTTFQERLFLTKEQIHDLFDGNEIAVSMYQEMKWKYIQDSGVKLEDLITPQSYPGTDIEEKKAEPITPAPEPEKVVEPQKTSGALAFLRGNKAA